MDSMQFEITNNENNKIVCDVIATYHDDDTNKDFIIYTDRTLDNNNNLNLYYSLYTLEDNNIRLIKITNQTDKKIGLELIKEIMIDIK